LSVADQGEVSEGGGRANDTITRFYKAELLPEDAGKSRKRKDCAVG